MATLCGLIKVEDEDHWRKFLSTVCVAFAFMNNGLFYGLLGPSLPDLQHLTNTDLQGISHLIVAAAVGRMLGAITGGEICDRTQKPLYLLMGMTFLGGLSTAALPWAQLYPGYLAVAAVCGFCTGGISVGVKVETASIWGKEARHYFQFNNFCFALGGTISPFIARPFFDKPYTELLDLTNATTMNETVNMGDFIQRLTVEPSGYQLSPTGAKNVTNATYLHVSETFGPSLIKFPFAIVGGTYMLAFLFLLLITCLVSDKSAAKAQSSKGRGKTDTLQPLPKSQLVFFLVIIFFLYIAAVSVKFIHQAYLMTFAVRQMKWTRTMGAVLTSVMWGAFGFGRLLGIVVARCVSPTALLYLSLVGMFLTSFGQVGGGYFHMDILIWIFVPMMGMTMSVFAPGVTVWIKENLVAITGKVASFIIVTTSFAMLTFPLFLGYLMDKSTPLWFVYVQPLETFTSLVLFTILVVGVKVARKRLDAVPDSETKPLLKDGGLIQ